MDSSARTIFERGALGRRGASLPALGPEKEEWLPPAGLRRSVPARLPQVSEGEAVRHYVGLSVKNYHVDKGFYPLGSCTMKYNPKINEDLARLAGFCALHPEQPAHTVQGALALYAGLEDDLRRLSGFHAVTLQPAAGAHGEWTGLLMIRAYHQDRGEPQRTEILIPDSAHGTNPASAALCGFHIVPVASGPDGRVQWDDLIAKVSEKTAAFMITHPNTLGLYENRLPQMAARIHEAGGLVYMDGANFNALVGQIRPADLGVDLMHFNLHKTFSTPHGGGGPGAGPVGVCKKLEPFLPVPRIRKTVQGEYEWDWNQPLSVGRVHGYYGNFLVLVRAYAYLRTLGREGVAQMAPDAILNANYLFSLVRKKWEAPFPGPVAHEFVLSARAFKSSGIRAIDVAKRLIDLGYHPPTIYFPLIVPEALMIEPTETEGQETLDAFAETLNAIAEEAISHPEKLQEAPVNTPVRRLDETLAARNLKVKAF